MSCRGSIPVATKVDRPMRQFLENESERLGVTMSELLRRLFVLYRRGRAEEMACEHCGRTQHIDLTLV